MNFMKKIIKDYFPFKLCIYMCVHIIFHNQGITTDSNRNKV